MKGLTLGLMIVAIVAVVGIVLATFFTFFWRNLESAGAERVQERFAQQQILRSESSANFFGLESRGLAQIRGNGVLVLTPNELWFSRFVMRDDISIPLETVREVRLVDAHLSKRIFGRKLLYISFQTVEGIDAAAWAVAAPDEWRSTIAQALPN